MDSGFAMISTLAVLNIIWDRFHFRLRWGMMGAAVTVIRLSGHRSAGSVVSAAHEDHRRGKGRLPAERLHLRPYPDPWHDQLSVQISLVAAMAAINNMIRKYGALDTRVRAGAIRPDPHGGGWHRDEVLQIVISIVVGMAAAASPIVGFNMGAKKPDRVKELFTRLLLAEAAVGVVALVLVECFRGS